MNIEQSKEMVKFIVEMGEALEKALEDGSLGLSDLPLLIKPMMNAGKAFDGWENIDDEIKDMDEAEKKELEKFMKEELDLENDKIEKIVEKSFSIGLDMIGLIKLIKKDEPKEDEA